MHNNGTNRKPRSNDAARNTKAGSLVPEMHQEPSPANSSVPVITDYRPVIQKDRPFLWNADLPASELYPKLAARLGATGVIFRRSENAAGIWLVRPDPTVPPVEITKGNQLAPVIIDLMDVVVVKDGKFKGSQIPKSDLGCMLQSERFLQEIRPVDEIVQQARYLGDTFEIATPGYNDHGRGARILYVGEHVKILDSQDTMNRFLDVMAFASNADRSNTVAAALTVMLRNYFAGEKPAMLVTSTKSHGGKDTIVAFCAGRTPKVSISYEGSDWALQQNFIAAVKFDPRYGVVNVENARLTGAGVIASGFLERFITDDAPLLQAPRTGPAVQRANHWVVAITTNFGTLSEDLMNRGLPIHLAPVGDVATRVSPIGNPKEDFLPANRDRIEAELRGMIRRWKSAGMPMDTEAKHPFTAWARTIGGILKVNGYSDFLGNVGTRKTIDDPLRKALGQLGAYRPDEWMPVAEWVPLVSILGLTSSLIPAADRESAESRRRGLGVVMSAHQKETFDVETDDEAVTLRLEKARRRFDGLPPEWRYRFVIINRQPIPDDARGSVDSENP